ncbi:hypothetical protein [Marinobacter sp. Hex_13]|uniref:hypothetical protein n=1 Tax=Marinobacter sp. Hex_13 TaxID=1795866 RepID=UPI000A991947|nr:hypothetical protein [Marinobacter sp. Hex_13]
MSRRFLRLSVRVTVRWWVPLYIRGVIFISMITGREPDPVKVEYWVKKGMKTEVVED